MKAITEARYAEATEAYEGWCTACEEFTHESAEPDARGYRCPVRAGATVYGAEVALLMGAFDFGPDEEG